MLIEAQGVTKLYGPLKAMDDVSLSVREGEIFGIFGPNGAGKTTTVRALAGLTRFDYGEITVCGIDVKYSPNAVRKYVSVLMELPYLYEYMRARQYLRFFARLSNIPILKLDTSIKQALALVEMWDQRNKKIITMSSGQKQRLELARVLLSNAQVLILDEPFTMVDIDMRRKLREFLKAWCGSSRCIFYTSHNIIESEHIVDRFSFISNGRIKAVGGARDLRQKLLVPKFFLDVSDREKAYTLLQKQRWVSSVDISRNGVTVGITDREDAKLIPQLMVNSKIDLYEMKGMGTMEDVFDRVVR
jgi:ABC-type multidrug transport system ATPase subunit